MKIGQDKWQHLVVGIVIGVLLQGFLFFLLREHVYLATAITFILILIICYGFELFSKLTGKGTYDIMDAVAGTIGGVLGMAGAWWLIV